MSTLIPAHPRAAAGASLARLIRLHLMSRRVPAACAVLVLCAPLLQWAVRSAMSEAANAGAPTSAGQLSLLLEALAAAVVSAALHGPFGESERLVGRRLPWLRSATAVLVTAVALLVVWLGLIGTRSPVGDPAALRDTAGLIGIGILGTAIVGGHFAWVGPAGYWVVGAYAVSEHWHSPWAWPARPGADLGAALCAYGLLAASFLVISVVGPRQDPRD